MRVLGADDVVELIREHEARIKADGENRLEDSREALSRFGANLISQPERTSIMRMLTALDRAASAFRADIEAGGRKQQVLYEIFKDWLESSPVDEAAFGVMVRHVAKRLDL